MLIGFLMQSVDQFLCCGKRLTSPPGVSASPKSTIESLREERAINSRVRSAMKLVEGTGGDEDDEATSKAA